MPTLKVRPIAETQGLNMSQLQKVSGVTMPTVRRYWYSTQDGKTEGKPLKVVDLTILVAFAKILGVKLTDLIEEEWLTQLIASSANDTTNWADAEANEMTPIIALVPALV